MSEQTVTMTLDEVLALARNCLSANGCDDDNANAVAATISAAERDGAASHGLFRLPGYVASLRSDKVDGAAKPVIEKLAPGVVRADGNGGFAPLALEAGRKPLIECARSQGIGALALTNIHHFAALWIEVEALAQNGLAAFAFTAYKPALAPAGSTQPLFGTNPMAFGWPRGDKPPMVFDQASAAMARGEIMIAARDGHELPAGVGVDKDGNETTDPSAILEGGAILPFGGYKGSAIAMMVELLVAGLIGQDFSFEAAVNDNNDGGPPRGGELMLAIDPAHFGDPDGWLEHAESFFKRYYSLEGTRLPADRRYANRVQNIKTGVEVRTDLRDKILDLTVGQE